MSQPVAGITEEEFPGLFLEQSDFKGTIQMIQDSSKSGPDAGDRPFAKQHGLFAGFRVWLDSADKPLWRIVDIRFVFPSAEQARLYHQARLQANSEGHPLIAHAPGVGADCHVFGGAAQHPLSPDLVMVVYYYVFQVHNTVVKLFVAQGPEVAGNKLDISMVTPLARAIEARIKAQAS